MPLLEVFPWLIFFHLQKVLGRNRLKGEHLLLFIHSPFELRDVLDWRMKYMWGSRVAWLWLSFIMCCKIKLPLLPSLGPDIWNVLFPILVPFHKKEKVCVKRMSIAVREILYTIIINMVYCRPTGICLVDGLYL